MPEGMASASSIASSCCLSTLHLQCLREYECECECVCVCVCVTGWGFLGVTVDFSGELFPESNSHTS